MTQPTATYRLQFRNGMDFTCAIGLIPHLVELGISHLYVSPIFTAVEGSTHGYDVTNVNEIDPSLGGRAGFEALAKACHKAGLGILLDIVPNHMAASLQNPWWRSVIEWGEQSPYAHYFDIDWRSRLSLPFLGKSFEAEAAEGNTRLAYDPSGRCLALRYHDEFYPLCPATYGEALADIDDPVAQGLASIGNEAVPKIPEQFHGAVADLVEGNGRRAVFETALHALSQDADFLANLHALQPWQLRSWTTASQSLSYRRFFEIAGLVGVRVEDRAVFDDSHRLVAGLLREGLVDGIRVDHIDGLADPKAYLDRLRQLAGADTFITVEKILKGDEELPADWPISGTTGYEFIASLAGLLAKEGVDGKLGREFEALSGNGDSFEDQLRQCKTLMLTENFAGEVEALVRLAFRLSEAEGHFLAIEALRAAIVGLIVEVPVYRSYAVADGTNETDSRLLDTVAQQAGSRARDDETRTAIAFLTDLLKRNRPRLDLAQLARVRARFQQVSGAVLAKALEDTLFYRNGAVLALNEVGGDPAEEPAGAQAFHRAMALRASRMPLSLSATATHDTKRGEDARARLYAITEAPDNWIAGVRRWRGMNSRLTTALPGGTTPEPAIEWTIYQALLGVWPIAGTTDPDLFGAIRARMQDYLEKALREAKLQTSWAVPNKDYENSAKAYLDGLLDPGNTTFLADFHETAAPFMRAGSLNTMTQTLIKLTAPGIPDIYQGAEGLDFSLVDPDNRRPLRIEKLSVPSMPVEYESTSLARYKQWLVATGLSLRRGSTAGIFAGDYVPLEVVGKAAQNVLAFMRRSDEGFAVSIVPRLVFPHVRRECLGLDVSHFAGTQVVLPASCAAMILHDTLSGSRRIPGTSLDVGELFETHPVALLLGEPSGKVLIR